MLKGIFLAAVAATRITAISNTFDGIVGVDAINLETGQRLTWRSNEAFPMGSVYKVPIAIALLQRVDRGEVSLADKATLGPDDFHPGWSPIADEANGQPVTFTVGELLERMLRDSDNSACDYLLAHYVAPKEVMKTLKGLRVSNVDVSRPEAMIVGQMLKEGDIIVTRAHYAERAKTISQAEKVLGLQTFWRDTRDTATPAGLADLFTKIYKHQVGLKSESEELLLKPLREAPTGVDRIRAGIPTDARLVHKTGTMPGTTNDAGIVTTPDGKHLVIVVLTKWSNGTEADRAHVIAQMTKAVYEGLTQ